ncbi:MAG: SDR family oxidoreductase, partial [Actinomycetota bacterium]
MSTSRILITGGASGIGAAIARHWSNLGHDITITDVNDIDGRALATELGCTYVHLDVRDEAEWRAFATTNGAFDVVFLNAGVATGDLIFGNPDTSAFTSFDLAAYRRTLGVNVDGVVFGVAHLAPAMVARGSGDIVVTASMASIYPIPPDPIYGLSKHAVSGFVKSLAPALHERG